MYTVESVGKSHPFDTLVEASTFALELVLDKEQGSSVHDADENLVASWTHDPFTGDFIHENY